MPLKNVQRWQAYAPPPAFYRDSPGDTIVPATPPDEDTVPRIDVSKSISIYNYLYVLVQDAAGAVISVWVEHDGQWYLFGTQTMTGVNECILFEGVPATQVAVTSDVACKLFVTVTE